MASAEPTFPSSAGKITVETIAGGLAHPWSLAFLPDGRMLVTERPGRMRIVTRKGQLSPPLGGVPKVFAQGQAGLMDVVLARDFEQQPHGLLSAMPSPPMAAAASRCRAHSWSTTRRRGSIHRSQYSGRKARCRAASISAAAWCTRRTAICSSPSAIISARARLAQNLDNHIGKIIRITPDGAAPHDNPFVGRQNALPEIWAYGHPQSEGLAINPADGKLWEQEHGPMGGDEINIIETGKNYGWPLVSYGVNYDGTPVGNGKATMAGIERSALALDAVDRAVRHGLLHRRSISRVEGQPVQWRAEVRNCCRGWSSRATRP